MSSQKPNIAIFISGRGSNMQAIIQQHTEEQIANFQIAFVFSSNPQAKGLEFAQKQNIQTYSFEKETYQNEIVDKKEYEKKILEICKKHSIKYILCAGYMKIIGFTLLNQYQNNILNIHPSLLPSFKGLKAQQQAIDYAVKYSGCTVHLVNNEVDAGTADTILAQEIVPIKDGDDCTSLSKRILKEEHKIYYKTAKKYISEQEKNKVSFIFDTSL